MTEQHAVPPKGFSPITHPENFMGTNGPWFSKQATLENDISGHILGIRLLDKHTNVWGRAHGGFLVTMADSAMGYNLTYATTPQQSLVTVSLTSEFLQSPKPGDWIEAHVCINKIGKRLSFSECKLMVENKVIFKASGVFAVI